ncbi:MAG: hypothetical protein ABFS56_20940 [Pseudomonadota bacterium]
MFNKIIEYFKRRSSTKQTWLCPICLENFTEKDMEWRCVDGCQSSYPVRIDSLDSNALDCPTDACSQVLTRCYIKDCAYPFSEKINMRANRYHHCVIISLDGKRTTSKKGVAAFLYGLRLLLSERYKLTPALPETMKIWGFPELKDGKLKLKGVEPVAVELSSRTQKWPLLVYLHETRYDDFGQAITVKDCGFKKSNFIQGVAKAQSMAICINAEDAFEEQRRKKIESQVSKLYNGLRAESRKGLDLRGTSLWIVLANQCKLFERLEQNDPEIKPLKPVVPLDDNVLSGYVLDTARLKPLLLPILEFPWQQVRFAMFDAPFDSKESVMGLSSWIDEIEKVL